MGQFQPLPTTTMQPESVLFTRQVMSCTQSPGTYYLQHPLMLRTIRHLRFSQSKVWHAHTLICHLPLTRLPKR